MNNIIQKVGIVILGLCAAALILFLTNLVILAGVYVTALSLTLHNTFFITAAATGLILSLLTAFGIIRGLWPTKPVK